MSDVIYALTLLALLALAMLASTVAGGLSSLNHFWLKRQAQASAPYAKAVYALQALGQPFYVSLWLLLAAANVGLVLLLEARIGWLLTLLCGSLLIIVCSELLPRLFLRKRVVIIAGMTAPLLRRYAALVAPVTRPTARLLHDTAAQEPAIYSKEELLSAFKHPDLSRNSDFSSDELHMLSTMLSFSDKKIRDVMTPRRMVTVVTQDEQVGPIMMDELHKTGYSRFPVVTDAKHFSFVGTLYLRDLVGQAGSKKVAGIMSSDVRYIHEEETLDHALRVFLKTHHHLFIVVNSFEEFVGVLTIEDVLEEIIGREIVDEFDAHDDLRAVATSLAQKEKAAREKTGPPTKK